jgi:cell wall-associated NlpC family hydrolase
MPSRFRALAVTLLGVGLVVTASQPAFADTVEDKRRQAQQVADQLERLNDRSDLLVESYNVARMQLEAAQADVAEAETRLAALEGELGGLKTQVSAFAVRSYVYAGQSSGLASLLSGDSIVDGAAQRQGYAAVALGSNLEVTDQLAAKVDDTQRLRDVLAFKRRQAEQYAQNVATARKQVEAAVVETQQLLDKAKGELAVALQEEQERRAAEQLRAARAAIAEAQVRAAAEAERAAQQAAARAAQPAARPAGGAAPAVRPGRPAAATPAAAAPAATAAAPRAPTAVTRPAASPATTAAPKPSGPRPGANVPAPSPGAGGAVAAAMSQLGVPYRFAAAEPGVAFDCSGLTQWAWGQAGVRMPHSAGAQYAMFPKVSLADIQPGDLVWYPGHIGMYVGGGQYIHSPYPGSSVRLTALRPGKQYGIARPR